MSFTLRNLFSEDDEDPQADLEGEGIANGSRENLSPSGSAPEKKGSTNLVSELLPFIPPAIVASAEVPMEKEVIIPLDETGSTDVRLSTVYEACPELFDAEITPLNDSTVTLPAKMSHPKETTKIGSSLFETPATPFGSPGFGLPSGEAKEGGEEDPLAILIFPLEPDSEPK